MVHDVRGRWLLSGAVAAVLACVGPGAGQAQDRAAVKPAPAVNDKEGPKPDPDGNPDKPVVLKAVPISVQVNGSVSFNENGVMNGQNSYFNIGFFVQPSGNMPLRSIRNVKIQKLVTDSGEDLTLGLREQNSDNFQIPDDLFVPPGAQDQNRGRNRRQSYITPAFPRKPCRKIAKLQGTCDVEVAQGPLKRVTVNKMSEVDGKRLKIDGMDDGWVQFSLTQDGNQRRMMVTSNASTIGKVARMYFFTPEGALMPNQGFSSNYSGQNPGAVGMNVYGQFSENTSVVVIYYNSVKTMSLPFEALDVPMPQIFAEGSSLFDMVLKPESLEDGFALADIVPGEKQGPGERPKPASVEGVPQDIKKLEEGKLTPEDDPAKVKREDAAKEEKAKAEGEAAKMKAAAVEAALKAAQEGNGPAN